MVSGGVNELIWHFAGYLRLTLEENGVPGVVYNGAGTHRVAGDEGSDHAHGHAHEGPEHVANSRLGFFDFVAPPA